MPSSTVVRPAAGALLLGLALLAPRPVVAQDFLFDRPDVTVSVLGGWVVPGEGSDVFDFTRTQLTVDAGDFASPAGMVEVAWRATERIDLAAAVEHTSRTVASEMRDWVTEDDRPIPQQTRFSRTRIMATVRGYLIPGGRSVSEFAWVPNRWSPYAGGGVGLTRYEFVQSGDFVDFDTLDIFSDELTTQGSGLSAHALAGLQVSLTPRFLLRGEYQYVWGDGSHDRDERGVNDFEGFQDIDLSGWRAMLGVSVRL